MLQGFASPHVTLWMVGTLPTANNTGQSRTRHLSCIVIVAMQANILCARIVQSTFSCTVLCHSADKKEISFLALTQESWWGCCQWVPAIDCKCIQCMELAHHLWLPQSKWFMRSSSASWSELLDPFSSCSMNCFQHGSNWVWREQHNCTPGGTAMELQPP